MAMNFINRVAKGSIDASGEKPVISDSVILTGAPKGTVVKSLELSTGNESSYVDIVRKDQLGDEYLVIRIEMKANDYLVLWEGFFVIPSLHKLILRADSNLVTAVANAVEMT